MKAKLKTFKVNYFRYFRLPNGEAAGEESSYCTAKEIRAIDFDDAWERWWRQNPCGDIWRYATSIEDEKGNTDYRERLQSQPESIAQDSADGKEN